MFNFTEYTCGNYNVQLRDKNTLVITTIIYILSDIDKALAFEWIAAHLDRKKFRLEFILLNPGDSALEAHLRSRNIPVTRIPIRGGWKKIVTFGKLWALLRRSRPDIIHTHLRQATLMGITAGYLSGVKTRIYTRHHAASNHMYHPHAVKHDRWMGRLSTRIVSISDVVSEVLTVWERIPKEKVVKIPHGFDLAAFRNPDSPAVDNLKRIYGTADKHPVVGVISRYIKWKGVPYVIDAFRSLLAKYPRAHLVLANASGPDAQTIRRRLQSLPPGAYTEIAFEPDIASLYRLFDLFVHVPISKHAEAFGQTYVEALASGVPSVFTLSGVAVEFIEHQKNALVVPFENPEAIHRAMRQLLEDENLRQRIIDRGRRDIERFGLARFIHQLEALYEQN